VREVCIAASRSPHSYLRRRLEICTPRREKNEISLNCWREAFGGYTCYAHGDVATAGKSTLLLFLLIALPASAYNGFVSFALGSLARSAELSVGESSRLIGLGALPFSVGNLLGPLADFGFSRRMWVVVTTFPAALFVGVSLAIPLATHPTASSMCALIAGFLMTLSSVAGGALITSITPADLKGTAAAWNQTGTMLGGIIGSAATLLLLRAPDPHLRLPILTTLFALPGLAALLLNEPPRNSTGSRVERLQRMGGELKSALGERYSLFGLLIFVSPVPSQAASNLVTAIAPDYRPDEQAVALVTGVGGNILGVLGCAIAGFVCDRVDRRNAYVLGGLYLGTCALALLTTRPSAAAYIICTSFYMVGAGYAIGAAFALAFHVVGEGGQLTGGTGLTLYTGAVAFAILYCTMAEGWVYDHAGRRTMFGLDASFNSGGALVMTFILSRFANPPARVNAAAA
jgi:PAT family beta-lactamase induction signal transducer AmpG